MRRAVLFMVLLLVLVGSVNAQTTDRQPEVSIYSQYIDSLVSVRTSNSLPSAFNSGFLYGPGYVVTSNHVVSSESGQIKEGIEVEASNGWKNAEVLTRSKERDIAILAVENMSYKANSLRISEEPARTGQEVGILGNPLGREDVIMTGTVTELNESITIYGAEEIENTIEIDAPIAPGNSGGPVINKEGELLGIVAARDLDEDIGYAIPAEDIRFTATQIPG